MGSLDIPFDARLQSGAASGRQEKRNASQFLAFYGAMYVVSLLPLLLAYNLPLRDFQAHLARMATIAAGPHDL
jgi:hypothetical protein